MSDEETLRSLRGTTTNPSKRQKTEMSVSELANLMKSQLKMFQRSTRDDIKKLGDKLTSQMDRLRSEITSDMQKMREENEIFVDTITKSVGAVKRDNNIAIERMERRNDLILSGVPYVQKEDLLSHYNTICCNLGYAENSIPLVDIRRLFNGKIESGASPVILIQFAINIQRNEFYSKYLRSLKTHSLSLSNLGFATKKRIYINENLSLETRTVRSKALQYKKSGKLTGVFSRDGIIVVKQKAADDDREISTAVPTVSCLERVIFAEPSPK